MEIVTFLYVFSLFIIFTPKLFFNFGSKNNWIEIIIHAILFTIIVSISYGFVRSKIYEGAIINLEFEYPSTQGLGMNQTTNVYQTSNETETEHTSFDNKNGDTNINNNYLNSPDVAPQSDIIDNTDPILIARQTSTTPFENFTRPSPPISLETPYKYNSTDPTNDNYMDSSVITEELRYDGFFYFMMKWPNTPSLQYQSIVWRQTDNPFLLDNSKIVLDNGAPGFKQFLPIQSSDITDGTRFNGLKYNGVQSILSRANRMNTTNIFEQIGTLNIPIGDAGTIPTFYGPNGSPVTQTELYIFKPNNTFKNFIDSITGTIIIPSEIIPASAESAIIPASAESAIISTTAIPTSEQVTPLAETDPEIANKSSEYYNFDFTRLGSFKQDPIQSIPKIDDNKYSVDGCNYKCSNDVDNSTHFFLQSNVSSNYGDCYCYTNNNDDNFTKFISESNQCNSNPEHPSNKSTFGSTACKSVYRTRKFNTDDLKTFKVDQQTNSNVSSVNADFSDISKISNNITNPIKKETANNNKQINFSNIINNNKTLTTTRTDEWRPYSYQRDPKFGWNQDLQFTALKK